MKYQAYPEYKDSGVECLGAIPTHWQLARIKHIAELTPKKPNVQRNLQCSFVPMEKLKTNSIILDEERLIDDVYDGYTYFKNEDILMAKVTPCFENKNIAVAKELVNQIGFGSTEIFVLRINEKASNKYLYYRLQEDSFMDIATAAMTGAGGLKRVPSEVVNNFTAAFPFVDEQEVIANFLDHETAKIDTLIEKQQQLIKLLKEKRQAVISHAVTKGLNPNAPMRDSGVEWLGEVPEHWKVCRIKQVAKLESGHTPDKKIESYWVECDIPWVSLNDSSQLKVVDYISETAIFLNEKGIANSSARKLPGRCVVFTRDASIGLAAITTRVMAVSQHVIAWICDEEKVIPEYLLLVFYAMKDELDRFTFGATLKTIGMPDVNKLTGSFPDIVEQKIIIEHVFRVKQTMDIVVSKAEEAIKIIQERRTALISAAVTGKIDVRSWQAPEPLGSNNETIQEVAA